MAQIQKAHMIRIDKRTDKEDLQTERLTRRREGGGGVIVRFDHSRWTHVTDDHFKAVLLDNPSLMIIRLIDNLKVEGLNYKLTYIKHLYLKVCTSNIYNTILTHITWYPSLSNKKLYIISAIFFHVNYNIHK